MCRLQSLQVRCELTILGERHDPGHAILATRYIQNTGLRLLVQGLFSRKTAFRETLFLSYDVKLATEYRKVRWNQKVLNGSRQAAPSYRTPGRRSSHKGTCRQASDCHTFPISQYRPAPSSARPELILRPQFDNARPEAGLVLHL